MCGKRESVDFEGSRELGVSKLRLSIFQAPARKLQERCVCAPESVACVRLKVCQLSQGALIFFPAGFSSRRRMFESLKG